MLLSCLLCLQYSCICFLLLMPAADACCSGCFSIPGPRLLTSAYSRALHVAEHTAAATAAAAPHFQGFMLCAKRCISLHDRFQPPAYLDGQTGAGNALRQAPRARPSAHPYLQARRPARSWLVPNGPLLFLTCWQTWQCMQMTLNHMARQL